MFQLLPQELVDVILAFALLTSASSDDCRALLKCLALAKPIRQYILCSPLFISHIKVPRTHCGSMLKHTSDTGFMAWLTTSLPFFTPSDGLLMMPPVCISLTHLNLSHSPFVTSQTVISLLSNCPRLVSLHLFNAPFVRLSELREELYGFVQSLIDHSPSTNNTFGHVQQHKTKRLLNLESLNVEFVGDSGHAAQCLPLHTPSSSMKTSFHPPPPRPQHTSTDSFYEICYIEHLFMDWTVVGTGFQMSPRPCSRCHIHIARRRPAEEDEGSGDGVRELICVRCQARKVGSQRRVNHVQAPL